MKKNSKQRLILFEKPNMLILQVPRTSQKENSSFHGQSCAKIHWEFTKFHRKSLFQVKV